jgi:CheY-like chemotaxis protein/anti-sigma regulatory factor (Ser/Thr protein kinase)
VTSTPTLLVDDDGEQRNLVAGLLARAGIGPIVEAASAREALALAAEHDFALVVLDVVMPERSGLDILPELHELVPHGNIVVLSNLPRHRVATVARARGATGYVEKRVAPDRLVTEILVAAAAVTTTAERISAQLPAEPIAARAARGVVRDALPSVDRELLDSIELLVSELVTNAVLHTSSAPRLEVHVGRGNIRIEVFDGDTTPPRVRHNGGVGGWGLQLVEQLASRWGTDEQPEGKVVWFEIDRV